MENKHVYIEIQIYGLLQMYLADLQYQSKLRGQGATTLLRPVETNARSFLGFGTSNMVPQL